MADKFDPYREALVVESTTTWSDECRDVGPARRQRIADQLHADPAQCAHLEYIRVATGFCRKITVTLEDADRVSKSVSS